MKQTLLPFIFFFIVALSYAKDKQPMPREHIYRPLIGKRVVIDALVWHQSKGVSGRVLLPFGDDVYVSNYSIRGIDGFYEDRLPHGKLVRLVGVLTYEHIPPVPITVQGYTRGFSYFALKMESFTVIERAEEGFPKLHPK